VRTKLSSTRNEIHDLKETIALLQTRLNGYITEIDNLRQEVRLLTNNEGIIVGEGVVSDLYLHISDLNKRVDSLIYILEASGIVEEDSEFKVESHYGGQWRLKETE
jgi:hypothetical protein